MLAGLSSSLFLFPPSIERMERKEEREGGKTTQPNTVLKYFMSPPPPPPAQNNGEGEKDGRGASSLFSVSSLD